MKPLRPLSPERILEIAKKHGQFEVSWRWRDEALMRRCKKLAASGALRFDNGRGVTIFYPTTAARTDGTPEGEGRE